MTAPSPNFVRASPFTNVLEQEPNNDAATATNYKGELPVAFNGIISQPQDMDFFRFTAKKEQAMDIHVIARQLRSPLDSVLELTTLRAAGWPATTTPAARTATSASPLPQTVNILSA